MKKARRGVQNHVKHRKPSKIEAAFQQKLAQQSIPKAKMPKPSIPKALRHIDTATTRKITYVLDTNVIMVDWESLFKFEEHAVCVPGQVWKELDNQKKGHTSEAFNVRRAIRAVDTLVSGKSSDQIKAGIPLIPPPEYINGKPHTGKLFFDFETPTLEGIEDTGLDLAHPDDRIILTCLRLKKAGKRVVLVTNDGSCRVKARIAGIEVEEYLNDTAGSIVGEEDLCTGFHEMPRNFWETCEFQTFTSHGVTRYTLTHKSLNGVTPNEFLVIPGHPSLRVTAVHESCSVSAETFSHQDTIKEMGILVRNKEQKFALQLLLDTTLPAVSIAGVAGSGKTYLTLAAGIHLCKEGIYKRIIFTRPTPRTDEDIGFLPGNEEEKLGPWMGALWDNIDALTDNKKDTTSKKSTPLNQKSVVSKKKAEVKFSKDLVQIKSMNYMKGRSISNTLIIVDETQDLTVKQLKMIATRVGEGSKIVFLGNVAQIDNLYLTEHTCGLSVLIRTFRDSPYAGHITLQSGVRSAFASLAEERL